jgi:hypothetical protein
MDVSLSIPAGLIVNTQIQDECIRSISKRVDDSLNIVSKSDSCVFLIHLEDNLRIVLDSINIFEIKL